MSKYLFERRFLARGLPGGISPADAHVQVFEDHMEASDLRLRKFRDPKNDEIHYILEKSYLSDLPLENTENSRIELSLSDYKRFCEISGGQIRFNRYEYQYRGYDTFYDIYLGDLWGLNTATVGFANEADRNSFSVPEIFLKEITGVKFFDGKNLVGKSLADVSEFLLK